MNEIEKAIRAIEDMRDVGASRLKNEAQSPNDRKAIYIGYDDLSALNWAIEALQAQLDREKQPEPLSLEQLKQMDGDPIWLQRNESGRWRICAGVVDNIVLLDGIPDKVFFSDYIFYTHKPRQEP